MYRTTTLIFCTIITLLPSLAQWSGGPLTVTAAARSRGGHVLASSHRGGAPYNDSCQYAVVNELPPDGSVVITGDNTGATDTEDFGNPVSWEAFSIDTCSTVTVSYCGTDPLFELVYSILIVGCPYFTASVQNNGTTFCDDGNVIITYGNLPGGTYHVPVLMTTGAQGPYTMTITSAVCDEPPVNDICSAATFLQVVQDCGSGTVAGDNANAVVNSAPSCATTQSQFQDVWYQFESGSNTEVVITLDPGSIGDMGVEVRDACAGTSVFCATGDTGYTVAVELGTNYRVRVFSNNDFGFGGTFGICVTLPAGPCDAGIVTLAGGGDAIIACANGGDPIELEQGTAIGDMLGLVLTDEEDTIVAVLAGNVLDPDGMLPGAYRVRGISYDGELNGAVPGQPLSGLSGTGGCLDVSEGFVSVIIEICQGVVGAAASGRDRSFFTTQAGLWLRWTGAQRTIALEMFDVRGTSLVNRTITVQPGAVLLVQAAGVPASGLYMVRISGPGAPTSVERVFIE